MTISDSINRKIEVALFGAKITSAGTQKITNKVITIEQQDHSDIESEIRTIIIEEVKNVIDENEQIKIAGSIKSTKGNELTIETHALFKENLPNFYGNVEGKDILMGKVDVVICDGFVGNIILKFAESIIEILKTKSKFYLKNRPFAKLGALIMMPAFKELKLDLDYQSYGGVPLLGANGISIIGHGHSSRVAIKNAVRVGRKERRR